MEIISCIEDIQALDKDLSKFIISCCPWATTGDWNPESIGFIFVLMENDTSSVNVTPHIQDSKDSAYIIDLEVFDLWEQPAIYDPCLKLWHVVTIIGQEFGAGLFLPSAFVNSLPDLHAKLEKIKRVITNQNEV